MARQKKLPSGMNRRGSVYYARFQANGRVIRKRLSSDLRAATEMLNELKARADKADFGLLDNDCSIEELKADYLRSCQQTLRPKTVTRYRQNLNAILRRLSVRKVAQLSGRAVVTFRADRLAEDGSTNSEGRLVRVSPRTINMEVGALSTMLNWGVQHAIIGSNPIAHVKPLPTDQRAKERRSLTLEEVNALFAHSPECLRPVWRMFMTTGVRHDELVNMRFADVDFERRTVTVQRATAKNHKAREIPLDDEMLATIERLRDDAPFRVPVAGLNADLTGRQAAAFSKQHVFVTGANTSWRNNLLRQFYAICERAGIDGGNRNGSVDIHSLRVSFTTLSIEHGANPKDVQAMLGHSTLAMTMSIYSKATSHGKRSVVNALPFARASAPAGVISMQNEPRMRPSTEPDTKRGGGANSQAVAG